MKFFHKPVTSLEDVTHNFEQLEGNVSLDLNVPWVNVKSPLYGAKGDGATDDTAAIQKAAAALSAHGGTLYFPPGKYKISSALNFDNSHSVKLVGAGGMSGGAQTATWLDLAGSTANISARTSAGFTIEDMTIDQSNGSFTGAVIDLTHSGLASDAAYAQISRCHISGQAAATAIVDLNQAILCSFLGSFFTGGISNISGSSGSYSNSHAFTGCTFQNATTQAILNPREAWCFSGCGFENLWGGGNGAINGAPVGLALLGCWTGDGSGGTVVNLSGGSGVFIAGCHLGGTSGVGVHLASGYTDATIVGNVFQSETTGIQFADTGANCLILSNDLTGVASGVTFTSIPTNSLIQGTNSGVTASVGALNVGVPNSPTQTAGRATFQTSVALEPTDANHWFGRLSSSGTGAGSFLKVDCGDDIAFRGVQIGSSSNNQVGFYGATPVARAARPVTLADVITVLVNLGLTA